MESHRNFTLHDFFLLVVPHAWKILFIINATILLLVIQTSKCGASIFFSETPGAQKILSDSHPSSILFLP